MHFCKMHGAGNDFIIIEDMSLSLPDDSLPALASRLCHRRMGIGADGLMLLRPAQKGGDFAMLFYNSDGSLGEMCGNGARCIAHYGYEKGYSGQDGRIETTAGLIRGQRISEARYRIRLNEPSVLLPHVSVNVEGQEYDCGYVELGRPGLPHGVLLYEQLDFDRLDQLRSLGRALRHASPFPKGANISFVKPLDGGSFLAVTYERGVEDFTLACGTGCGSISAVMALRGLCDGKETHIHMPGGELEISLSLRVNSVSDIFLTGPTCIVCEGETLEI